MLRRLDNLTALRGMFDLKEGYLINRNSNVNHGGRDVVHVLPLKTDCKGQYMKQVRAIPKAMHQIVVI